MWLEPIMNTLAWPFAQVMKACYWFTGIFGGHGNYVVALLLFALLMQILLSPFGVIQQKNSQKQAKMRPMEYLIRKKYAGRTDRATQQKMQNEIMELYQKEGYNPMSGCLPMLLQLVIIFPLYYVVINPLQHLASFSAESISILQTCFANNGDSINSRAKEVSISNLIWQYSSGNGDKTLRDVITGWTEVKDDQGNVIINAVDQVAADNVLNEVETITGFKFIPNISLFGFDLGIQPSAALSFATIGTLWFLILIPVINLGLTYLSQFLSRKLNPQPMQEASQQQAGGGMLNSMKIMLWAMPLMTFFFTFMFPAGIGIYWIFRTLLSMLQQFLVSRIIPIPKYSEDDLKKIEKEMREARKKAGKPDIVYNNAEVKPYRSLHHIDDDE